MTVSPTTSPSKKVKKGALPRSKTVPHLDPSKLKWLIHGPGKIGKSSAAATWPNALFAQTEEAHSHLSIYPYRVDTWPAYNTLIRLLKTSDGKRFETVVVDTVPLLFYLCEHHVCDHHGLEYPSDEKWGKGWDMVRSEWAFALSRLCTLGKGVIFIAHTTDAKVTEDGSEFIRREADMPKRCRRLLLPMVDIVGWMHAGTKKGSRVMQLVPSKDVEAGFRTEKGMDLPHTIEAGPTEWYEVVTSIFDKVAKRKGGATRVTSLPTKVLRDAGRFAVKKIE